jgi:hypothetical protein
MLTPSIRPYSRSKFTAVRFDERGLDMKPIAAFAVLLAAGCGGDSTAPDATRHFLLYTWQGTTTYIVGAGAVIGGNYVQIDSATVELRADGSVRESVWYQYVLRGSAAITKTAEVFQGRWVLRDGWEEVHLPLGTNPDALVGFVQPDQSLPLLRTWTRSGVTFGGNFLYLKR